MQRIKVNINKQLLNNFVNNILKNTFIKIQEKDITKYIFFEFK